VALGHASITGPTLAVWSASSWDRNTQRTSSGSTRPKTSSSQAVRFRSDPVSTMTGSVPRITAESM
jgi:hypothetical protein